jgi:hypothetical protein
MEKRRALPIGSLTGQFLPGFLLMIDGSGF